MIMETYSLNYRFERYDKALNACQICTRTRIIAESAKKARMFRMLYK